FSPTGAISRCACCSGRGPPRGYSKKFYDAVFGAIGLPAGQADPKGRSHHLATLARGCAGMVPDLLKGVPLVISPWSAAYSTWGKSNRRTARKLHLDWETVKELEKQYMAAQLARAGTPAPKVIAIDEIAIRKGHTYRTPANSEDSALLRTEHTLRMEEGLE